MAVQRIAIQRRAAPVRCNGRLDGSEDNGAVVDCDGSAAFSIAAAERGHRQATVTRPALASRNAAMRERAGGHHRPHDPCYRGGSFGPAGRSLAPLSREFSTHFPPLRSNTAL
jgi:hypothetical protein